MECDFFIFFFQNTLCTKYNVTALLSNLILPRQYNNNKYKSIRLLNYNFRLNCSIYSLYICITAGICFIRIYTEATCFGFEYDTNIIYICPVVRTWNLEIYGINRIENLSLITFFFFVLFQNGIRKTWHLNEKKNNSDDRLRFYSDRQTLDNTDTREEEFEERYIWSSQLRNIYFLSGYFFLVYIFATKCKIWILTIVLSIFFFTQRPGEF